MVVAFFGHSFIEESERVFECIKDAVSKIVDKGECVTFFCGGYGEFDQLCASACRLMKKRMPDCRIALVTPYIHESQQKKLCALVKNGEYDEIIYPPIESVPPRYAIARRNQWMVTGADIVIAYVKHRFGGAHRAMEYAKGKNKQVINLASLA